MGTFDTNDKLLIIGACLTASFFRKPTFRAFAIDSDYNFRSLLRFSTCADACVIFFLIVSAAPTIWLSRLLSATLPWRPVIDIGQ